MCGRWPDDADDTYVAQEFELPNVGKRKKRYNIAPTQQIAVVALGGDGVTRGLVHLRWGLVPNWANDLKGQLLINVRGESAAYKFGEQLRGKRCLVVAG